MIYRIDQFVTKIKAPIVCKVDGEELLFENGEKLATHVFEKYYLIDSVEIKDGKAILTLSERVSPSINSIGDEIVLAEDWIKEHKENYGTELNLFDGG